MRLAAQMPCWTSGGAIEGAAAVPSARMRAVNPSTTGVALVFSAPVDEPYSAPPVLPLGDVVVCELVAGALASVPPLPLALAPPPSCVSAGAAVTANPNTSMTVVRRADARKTALSFVGLRG